MVCRGWTGLPRPLPVHPCKGFQKWWEAALAFITTAVASKGRGGPEHIVAFAVTVAVPVAVIVVVAALIEAVTLTAVGGFFAAVAVVPIAIVVGGGPGPIVVVVVTDVVIISVVIFETVLLAAFRDSFAAVAVVLGFSSPARRRFWWRQRRWWWLGCQTPLRVRVYLLRSLQSPFQYFRVDRVHHFHPLGVCALCQPCYEDVKEFILLILDGLQLPVTPRSGA